MDTTRFGTIREAADELGYSRQYIWNMVIEGRMGRCVKRDDPNGAVYYVPKPFKIMPSSVDRGRPKKGRSKKDEGIREG